MQILPPITIANIVVFILVCASVEDAKEAIGAEVKEEEAEEMPLAEVADDDVKMEETDESWDHKRGRKRAASPLKEELDEGEGAEEIAAKKARQDAEVFLVSRDEDPFDKSLVVLDWCEYD